MRADQITTTVLGLIILFIICLGEYIYLELKKKWYTAVERTSARYNALLLFEKELDEYHIPSIELHVSVNSKAALDRFNYDKALADYVRIDEQWNIWSIRNDQQYYDAYKTRIEELPLVRSPEWINEHIGMNEARYNRIETSLCLPLEKKIRQKI